MRIGLAGAAGLMLAAGAAAAQDPGVLTWSPGNFAVSGARLGLGAGIAPQYPGADDYAPVPFPSFSFNLGRIPVQSSGQGVEFDLRPGFPSGPEGRNGFAYGPVIRYSQGRDGDDIDDARVAALAPVGAAPEVGLFLEVTFPVASNSFVGGPVLLTGRIAALTGLDGGHEGTVGEASIGLLSPGETWTVGGGLGLNAGSADWTQAFFGVTPEGSAASGLEVYEPEGGITSVGLSVFARYAINDSWGVNFLAGYTQLVGDAAESPIVTETGSAGQPFVGMGISYVFD